MAKRIVLVLVLIAAALFAYNYYKTGTFTLIPSANLSEEEKELDGLEKRVKQAVREYAGAGRAAGLSGADTTADAESARIEIQNISKRLDEIGRKASANVKDKVAKVRRELDEAKAGMGIR